MLRHDYKIHKTKLLPTSNDYGDKDSVSQYFAGLSKKP